MKMLGIIKDTNFYGENNSNWGTFIAGLVVGITSTIFATVITIPKRLTQQQIQQKINKYVVPGHTPHKTILMRY